MPSCALKLTFAEPDSASLAMSIPDGCEAPNPWVLLTIAEGLLHFDGLEADPDHELDPSEIIISSPDSMSLNTTVRLGMAVSYAQFTLAALFLREKALSLIANSLMAQQAQAMQQAVDSGLIVPARAPLGGDVLYRGDGG